MSDRYPIEAVIELERDDCKLTDAVMKLEGVKSVSRLKVEANETLHLIEKDSFSESDMHTIFGLSRKVSKTGPCRLWVYSKSCSACRALALSDAVIISSKSIDSKRILFRIMIENRASLKKLIRELEEDQLEPKMIEEPDEKKNYMTEREFSILKICYDMGYFDNERTSSLTEIAKVLGISTSSLSETLRRAMKKVVNDYFLSKNP